MMTLSSFLCFFLYQISIQHQIIMLNAIVHHYPRRMESRAKHFLIKKTRRSHLRYESIRGQHYLPL